MWHLAIYHWSTDPSAALPDLPEHLDWIREQQLAGRILFAGPSEDGQLGIIVFGHMSRDDAVALADADPFIAHGSRTYDLITWDVHQALGVGFQTTPVDVMTAHRDS